MRFTDHGDGTVTDTTTGLMWVKEPILESMTWEDAKRKVDIWCVLNHLGYSDWRLPEVKELISLVDYSRCNPALPVNHPFSNVQSSYYWSSGSDASNTYNAWIVDMWNGNVDYNYKTSFNGYVWPVRSGVREGK